MSDLLGKIDMLEKIEMSVVGLTNFIGSYYLKFHYFILEWSYGARW